VSGAKEAAVKSASVATNIHNELNILLSGAEQLAATLSQIPAVRNHDKPAVNLLLAKLLASNPQYANIVVIDTTGMVWASAIPAHRPVDLSDKRYFRNAMASGMPSSGEYNVSNILRKPVLNFGFPLFDTASGRITDVIGVAFPLDRYKFFFDKNRAHDSSILLVDHKGSILFSSVNPAIIGTQDREDLFRRMSSGYDQGAFESTGNRGIHRLFSYQKLRLKGEQTPYMYVRTGLSKESVFGNVHKDFMIHVGVLSSIMFFMIGVTIYISKRALLDKIIVLRDASQQIAKGNLDVRIADQVSGGELGELGDAFDEMAHTLEIDKAERMRAEEALHMQAERLEREVAERQMAQKALQEQTAILEEEVTDRQLAQEELAVKQQELEALNQSLEERINDSLLELRRKDQLLIQQGRLAAMGEMINNIAHQWRQPLNNVGLLVQSLQISFKDGSLTAEELDKEVASTMAIISHMSHTIDDFRNFFRSDKEKHDFIINNAVHKALDFIEASLVNSHIQVTVAVDENVTACGYQNEYAQVLLNILGNARDVLLTNKITDPCITICISSEKGRSLVTIRDNGGGIAEDVLPKIFDPYFTTKFQSQGTGIGLYMSKAIIEQNMDGSLTACNVDAGAEFKIVL
jgi:C4-dicarboxylate-specific signal transduction histidine kinase